MTTFAFAGRRQMRIRPWLSRVGHDNDAADTVKSAALHVSPMTSLAPAADAGMTHLPAGKRLEATDHRRLMATVTTKLPGIGQMIARHTLGTKIIVTGCTGERGKRRNGSVIKPHRRQERAGTVAGAATHAGWDVPSWLSLDMKAIMTSLAGTFLHHDVTENKPGEAR